MRAWRVSAVGLPDGGTVEGGIDRDGCWGTAPGSDAERLPGRFVLPGLVDAHCHLAVGAGDGGPRPLGTGHARANLKAAEHSGITLLRDMGGPGGVALRLPQARQGAGLLAAGRFLAPSGGYFPALFEPVPVGGLVEAVREQIAAGARWVKLIADSPPSTRG